MRIATIIGTVTLSRSHPTFRGATLKLAVPLNRDELHAQDPPDRDDLVVYDELSSSIGDRILLSEGAEAAQPFYPELKPVDAYNAGTLDHLQIDQ